MKNFIKWKNYLFIYALLLFALNLVLINFPLTDVFGYEFSALNAIAISFLTGFYVISFIKKRTDNSKTKSLPVFANLSLLLLIPFIVSVINSVFTGFCSFIDGLLFYLVITAPSILAGGALGIISFFVKFGC